MTLQVLKISPTKQAAKFVEMEIDVRVPGSIERPQQITSDSAAFETTESVSLADFG